MNWFRQLADNQYVDTVLISDNKGQILHSSQPIGSQDELIASMIQAADVLAQSLTAELQRGPVQMIQISTDSEHMLIFPLDHSSFHLVVMVRLDTPLPQIIAEIERMFPEIDFSELDIPDIATRGTTSIDQGEWNTEELIDAVREWLQNKSSGA